MRTSCVLAALALSLVGCGQSGPKKHDISGSVSYDGQPVTEGDITFIPENTSVGPEGGKIVDGKYSMKAPDGKCRVQITWTKVIPGKKDAMGGPFYDNVIPKKYNDETTLTADVESGKTTHDFNLPK